MRYACAVHCSGLISFPPIFSLPARSRPSPANASTVQQSTANRCSNNPATSQRHAVGILGRISARVSSDPCAARPPKGAKPVTANAFVIDMSWNCVLVVTFKLSFYIAKAIRPGERHVLVLHDRNDDAQNPPLLCQFRDEMFELGNGNRKGFARCDRFGCH